MKSHSQTTLLALAFCIFFVPYRAHAAPICEPVKDCSPPQVAISNNVSGMQLQPHSAVTIWAYGQCAQIENNGSEAIPIPVETLESWHDFTTTPTNQIKVTLCPS